MAKQVKFDYSLAKNIISEDEMKAMEKITNDAKDVLLGRNGAGSDFLGWIDLPVDYDKEEFARIRQAAQKIQGDSDVLLVIGIGGSYLGARAAIEFLRHSFYNNVSKEIRKTPEIYYCGNNLSGTYLSQLTDVIGDRDFQLMLSASPERLRSRPWHSAFLKRYLKRNTAKRRQPGESMPQRIRQRVR